MTKPSGRKIMLFVVLSVAYWVVASLVILVAAIRVCGMTPDSTDLCDPTPINMAVGLALGLFAGLSVLFFKFRLRGVDE